MNLGKPRVYSPFIQRESVQSFHPSLKTEPERVSTITPRPNLFLWEKGVELSPVANESTSTPSLAALARVAVASLLRCMSPSRRRLAVAACAGRRQSYWARGQRTRLSL